MENLSETEKRNSVPPRKLPQEPPPPPQPKGHADEHPA